MVHNVYDTEDICSVYSKIPVKDAKLHLQMKDNRTFRNWCKRMGITVFKDGRKLSVLQGEFIPVLIAQSQRAMQKKYGQNWQEGLRIFLETSPEDPLPEKTIKFKKYIAKTKETESFAQKWNHI